MKKQLNPTIKAHLIRSGFYLLLLLAVCAIPFALAQRNATRSSHAKEEIGLDPKKAAAEGKSLVPVAKNAEVQDALSEKDNVRDVPDIAVSEDPDLQGFNYPAPPSSALAGARLDYRSHLPNGVVPCGANNIRVVATNSANDADYATLKEAFDAINAGTHTGAITIGVCGNTTETASAVLNASGTLSASYTSVLMPPNASHTIAGAIAAGSPLIDLNGADNVTINGFGSLIITNTTVSATAGTSTIRLINGAQNNTIM